MPKGSEKILPSSCYMFTLFLRTKTLWGKKLNLRQIEPQVSEDKKGQIGPAKNGIDLQPQDKK